MLSTYSNPSKNKKANVKTKENVEVMIPNLYLVLCNLVIFCIQLHHKHLVISFGKSSLKCLAFKASKNFINYKIDNDYGDDDIKKVFAVILDVFRHCETFLKVVAICLLCF